MRRARGFAVGLLLGALIAAAPTGASACIWDRDTVAMERQRFPGALHLITGHFVHHGREFYEWRIEDRTSRLDARPDDLRLLDDLAAAYDKTGEHDAAIETMERHGPWTQIATKPKPTSGPSTLTQVTSSRPWCISTARSRSTRRRTSGVSATKRC